MMFSVIGRHLGDENLFVNCGSPAYRLLWPSPCDAREYKWRPPGLSPSEREEPLFPLSPTSFNKSNPPAYFNKSNPSPLFLPNLNTEFPNLHTLPLTNITDIMLENKIQKQPRPAGYVEKVPHLAEVYALKSTDISKMREIYDQWASTYDQDLADPDQDYVGPALASTYILRTLGTARIGDNIEILDAGCGTGLVGIHLAKLGATKVDGLDLSPGMLDVARKTGAYRFLDTADLSKTMAQKDNSYDVISCVGTLTQGHVGPDVLDEFARVVKRGGLIVTTILESIYAAEGYKAKVDSMVAGGKVKISSAKLEDYRRGAGVKAWMIVLEVL